MDEVGVPVRRKKSDIFKELTADGNIDTADTDLFDKILVIGETEFRFAMNAEGASDGWTECFRISNKPLAICVCRKPVNGKHGRAQVVFVSVNLDGSSSFDKATTKGIFRLKSGNQDKIKRVLNIVFQMMQNASTLAHAGSGNDDDGAFYGIQCH